MKKSNLKFYNISESPRESQFMLLRKLADVLKVMDIDLERMLIDNIHRLPSSSPGPRPIVVKFCSFLDRDFVWSRRHVLGEKKVNVYINEHYNTVVESNIRKLLPIKKAALKLKMKARLVADKLMINSQSYNVDNLHQLPEVLQPANLAIREEGEHLFFFSEANPLSNFYPISFTIERVLYTCSEQYIQSRKAIQCGDTGTAASIMEASSPYIMKSLGSKIRNFHKDRWIEYAPEVAMEALKAKFSQNQSIRAYLLNTGSKTLVEAAPKDMLWGIGCSLRDPGIMQKKEDWGRNLQGKVLMEVRLSLRT